MNASPPATKILLIGIGNSGRSDDALGWKFLDTFDAFPCWFDFEYRYQLQVEDAELISRYKKVIFVDASREVIKDGASLHACIPTPSASFTTHKLDPGTVLWLARELYTAQTEAYVMAIAGTEWELHHGLSTIARTNLQKALSLFLDFILHANLLQPKAEAVA
ncbi:MAG: hypothetical protein JNM57_14100 [Cyclobacteriaceae bacterium]|nr:hypothetical protein [Cyclobacteriaceae bacterium]